MAVLTERNGAEQAPLDVAVPAGASGSPLPRTHLVRDELDQIVSTVCARYPGRPRDDVEALVSDAYDELRARARVTAHLIPLTLNRTLRLMREANDACQRSPIGGDADGE